jgi:hypothetical protein
MDREAYLRSQLEAYPDDPFWPHTLGVWLMGQNRWEEAEKPFRRPCAGALPMPPPITKWGSSTKCKAKPIKPSLPSAKAKSSPPTSATCGSFETPRKT